MKDNNKWLKWIIGLAVVAFLFANPITRRIILFLLPLGRGVDDFIELLAILTLIGVALARGWIRFNPVKFVRKLNQKTSVRVKQAFLTAVLAVSLFLIPYTGNQIWDLLLFGKSISDPTFFVILGVDIVVLILGWNILSWRYKK